MVSGSVHGSGRSFLLLFTVLGDTYPQKHTVKLTNSRNFCIWRERCSTFWAPAWPLAWPGPQDGLGQGGLRLKWAKGRFGSKNDEKVKVLRMEFSIVENPSGLQESIFNLSRGPQLQFGEKSKKMSFWDVDQNGVGGL